MLPHLLPTLFDFSFAPKPKWQLSEDFTLGNTGAHNILQTR